MDDRELLELAAKAAGINLLWRRGHPYRGTNNVRQDEWNPLTDDGDALRLARDLLLKIDFAKKEVLYNTGAGGWDSCQWHLDCYRGAIIRAAAEMAKASHE